MMVQKVVRPGDRCEKGALVIDTVVPRGAQQYETILDPSQHVGQIEGTRAGRG